MKQKRYNLKKAATLMLAVYVVVMVLFTGIAWEKIQLSRIGVTGFLILEGVGLLFLIWYGIRMVKRDDGEKETLLGRFFQIIAKYQFLIEQLVSRDFKIKYKRSVLGVFWSFLNPLLMMAVQYVVFSQLLARGGAVEHYAIYLLCGIVIFNGFNDCSTQAMRAITGNATLITKVYVPKYIYPVTKVLSAGINLVLSMVPLLLVTVIYGLFAGLYLTPAVLLIPIGLLFLLIFTIGMGFLLSSLMVFFRDVEFLWGVISTIWMYATPIIYSVELLHNAGADWLVAVMQFNPMYHYVDFFRSILIRGQSPDLMEYVICAAFSFGMLAIGGWVFHKTQDKFVLYI